MMQISQLLKEHQLTDKFGNTLLHLTMKNEKFTEKEVIGVLEILLDSSVNLDIENGANETVLQLAIKRRMKDVINLLLAHKFNTNSATHFMIEDEYTNFRESFSSESNYYDELDSEILKIEIESASFVEWLISRGFDFDFKNEDNESALFIAIKRNLQHVLPVLLKYTKDINFVDKSIRNWLHLFIDRNVTSTYNNINKNWYSKRYTADIVKILLDRGVSADAKDDFEYTPIRIAIEKREDIDIVEVLLDNSKNFNDEDSEEKTLFHMVVRRWANFEEKDFDYYVKIARALVAKGANINKPSKSGMRPVRRAIEAHSLRIVEFLRDNGADFNVTTRKDETLMHLLIESKLYGKTDNEMEMRLFDLVLELTTNIHRKDCIGETAFYKVIYTWACSESAETDYYMRIARAFIAKGADVNEPDKYGTIPAFHAIHQHDLVVAEFLRDNGAVFNMTTADGRSLMHILAFARLHSSSYNEEVEIQLFDILIQHGCQVNPKDNGGTTALHIAAATGNLSISQKLIEHGADVNCKDNQMETPLTKMAISYYALNVDVAELLLQHGANVDAKNIKGFTALHVTAFRHRSDLNVKMIEFLLERGADLNVRTRAGHSVLRMGIWYDFNRGRHKEDKVDPESLPSLVTCINDYTSTEVKVLLKHYIKINILKGTIAKNRHKRLMKMEEYNSYCNKCLDEIESLKNTFIDSHTSLYKLLRMDPNSRRAYIHSEQHRELLNSPVLKKQFPKYATLILASYYEALARKALLKPATEAWLELTKIGLPDVCIERIFSFLSNSNLFVIIERD